MKLLFDFLPIILFFAAFKLYGIYAATAIAILASLAQLIFVWVKHKKIEMMYVITFVIILVMGSATLLLHEEMFIKWKPTVLYWLFFLLLFGSQFIGKKPLMQRLMENNLILPPQIWQRLNWSWALFCLFLGAANLYVVYHFSTNTWVNFKMFGCLGLTLLFSICQGIYMAKHGTLIQK